MNLQDWADEHKGVRRSLVALCGLWVTGVVAAGVYYLPELTAHSVQFIREVMLLAAIPMGWYFYQRGKE